MHGSSWVGNWKQPVDFFIEVDAISEVIWLFKDDQPSGEGAHYVFLLRLLAFDFISCCLQEKAPFQSEKSNSFNE